MRLGRDTGSLVNYMMAGGAGRPAVGDGATVLAWTDRYAATVVEVTDDLVSVREDRAVRTDDRGMSEAQAYRYEANPNGRTWTFRRTATGWREVIWNAPTKRWRLHRGMGLALGHRAAYRDFSF